jgi:AcrR family transcriptional regulator
MPHTAGVNGKTKLYRTVFGGSVRTKSESRRQAILATAAETFHERGFDATSMSEVASRLGGSKATLYNYFDSKELLFVTVMLEKARAHVTPVINAFSNSADIEAAVRRFTLDYLHLILAPEILVMKRMCLAQADRCGFGAKIYEEAIKPAWTAIAQRLQAAMDEGKLYRADIWLAAMHLKGLCESGLLEQCMNGCRGPATEAEIFEYGAAAAEAFLRAYRPQP